MVQWLIVCTSTAGGMGLIPGLVGELKSPMPHGVAKKKKIKNGLDVFCVAVL